MTVREAFVFARKSLSDYEARIVMEELFRLGRWDLSEKAGEMFDVQSEERLREVVRQRTEGMPLQYLLGHWTFMDREYAVGEGVLIPRDDTEVAVRKCLKFAEKMSAPKVLDLCAGSGIIALTIAQECPDAEVTAVEKEERALYYLRENVQAHQAVNVQVMQGDIFDCHTKIENNSFDLLVSNPPYIRTDELPALQKEVQREPRTALDGGQDGLMFYRCIAEYWTAKLHQGGRMVLEIGEEQAQAVTELLYLHGFEDIGTIQDIQGLDRVVYGTKK